MLAYNLHTDDRAVARGVVRGGGGKRGRARRCILAFHVCFHLNGNRVHNVIVFAA